MNCKIRKTAAALIIISIIAALSGCADETSGSSDTEDKEVIVYEAAADLNSTDGITADDANTVISLNGDSVSVSGPGTAVSGSTVAIMNSGIYEITGTLNDGRIIVDANNMTVVLVLNGADITCTYGSPIYVYDADYTAICLAEGTRNTLTDGETYTFDDIYSSAEDEEPNACLYSKDDLVIGGSGSLTVNANYNNGITSKDTLEIYDADITVNAVNHGINGKDSNTIDNADITVTCGGDAVRSTNEKDETLGWLKLTNSTFTLNSTEDGIQAETAVTLGDVVCDITSGGKGIKAGTSLTIESGTFTLNCTDDAVHSNGDVTVNGGEYTISTGDDAFHSDGTLTITDGDINITRSHEGLEGADIEISGGDISIVADDDGMNAAGGSDGSGLGGFEMGFAGGTDHVLNISGGTVTVTSGGDGLDSNGTMTISGGTVTVCSTGNADGALDSETGIDITGGVVFAATGGSMPEYPDSPEQNTINVGLGGTVQSGAVVSFSGDGWSYEFTLTGYAQTVIFSAPELIEGDVCTVTADGETVAEVTIEDGLTTSGTTGGMFGGGTMGGGGMFGGGGGMMGGGGRGGNAAM